MILGRDHYSPREGPQQDLQLKELDHPSSLRGSLTLPPPKKNHIGLINGHGKDPVI